VQPTAPDPPVEALKAEHTLIECVSTTERIKPAHEKILPVAWSNALGAKYVGVGIDAFFDPAALAAQKDCTLVVIATKDFPRKYKLPRDVWAKTF
jgi:hypothetical protein